MQIKKHDTAFTKAGLRLQRKGSCGLQQRGYTDLSAHPAEGHAANASPAVSIVIPAYNHAAYLRQAIDSVLAQDYPVELIVLDDGSTDGTRAVMAQYADRCRCETHQNMGQAATLNKGWAMAAGDIFGYLSADDVLRPGCVRSAAQVLAASPSTILTYCDFELIDSYSRVLRTVQTEDFDYGRMVVDAVCTPGPGVFFRRTVFERAGGWDTLLRQMPDYEYWLRVGLFGEFKRIPRALAAFRMHERSLTFALTPERNAEEPVLIMEKYFSHENIPDAIQDKKHRAMSNALLFSAQLHLRSGRYQKAFQRLRRAAVLSPANLFRVRFLQRVAHGLFSRVAYRLLWLLKRSRLADREL
jgi:glycosyltransferase involved in cell wall biosynthesis